MSSETGIDPMVKARGTPEEGSIRVERMFRELDRRLFSPEKTTDLVQLTARVIYLARNGGAPALKRFMEQNQNSVESAE